MIVVTGGAGFIGSNLVAALNQRGMSDILVVDDLTDGFKCVNLSTYDIADYHDADDFLLDLQSGHYDHSNIKAIFHCGACSATTERNGRYLMKNNFEYSKVLLHWCLKHNVQLIYASSASVYGRGLEGFREERALERPLNPYAFSKHLFDQYVRRHCTAQSRVVGLRYFNVYGFGEAHKGSMASTIFHFNSQVKADGVARLFAGMDGYADGEQQRDFVSVEDCSAINMWFFEHPDRFGIFNVGTGEPSTFNDVAHAVIQWHGRGRIEYIPFPAHLLGAYQNYTSADLMRLRGIGYERPFLSLQEGVRRYLDKLNQLG